MGSTYTRQSSTEIVDGEVIQASDFNNEFEQIVSAFAVSTGHSHDGTTAEGGPVTKLLGTAITIGDATSGTDIAVTFDGESSDGVLTWMEDEDHFKFSDDVVIDSSKRIYLYDEGGEYIYGDGTDLYLVSGADINIPANIGLTFGDDGEKIEGDGTDLTISGNNINLTATADVVIPADVGITFGSGEKIEGNSTDLTVTSGADINLTATSDVNIPSGVGVTFGDDGEKIEGDGTDLTISASALFNVDAGTDIVLDADGGDIFFKDGGTTFGSATNTSGNLIIKSGTTTALTFSGANATIAGDLTVSGDDLTMGTNTDTAVLVADGTNFNPVVPSGDVGLTNAGVFSIASGVIVNADINASAAIADSKLDTISTANKVGLAALDIDGGTDIGEAIVDADLFIIDNGAGGTNRKTAASRLKTYISSSAADPASADGDSLGTASLEWSDLYLADGGIIYFGNDQEITLTHAADDGLILKHVGTGDGKEPSLTFQAGDNDIAVNDVLGSIFFQAPDEGAGTDAILVAAGIEAVSEGNFAADNNATKLIFKTAASEAASEKMSLSSAGLLTVADDIVFKDGGTIGVSSATDAMTVSSAGIVTFKDDILIKDGGTIGSASSTGAITIASTGIVTFVDDILIKDAGTIGSASDPDAISISSGGVVNISATTANTSASDGALTVAGGVGIAADLSVGDDLRLISDDAVLSFGANSDVTVTHDPDDGLFLKSIATADNNPILLTLQTGETDMAADDVMGKISFQAPDEGAGTDAILVAAAIQAVAEGDFSSSNNATSLQFMTGASEVAAAKMSVTSGGDVKVLTDGASIFFGADSEIELRHVADDGLILKHVGTGDGKEPSLTFQAGDNDIAADDILGSIFFQAPDEGAGTDAILVAAGIQAVSEGNFSSSNNATSLEFMTGASEAAATKMTLTSAGTLNLGDNNLQRANLIDYGEVTNAIGATGGGTQDIDLTLGNNVVATVDTGANTFTFSNPTASDELCGFTLFLTNGGSQTVNWPGTVDWAGGSAPTLTTSGLDILVFITTDGGTIWHGMVASAASA